ncbi:GIY-YIG nuclease family protein [Thalassobaculum sp.]|uniref:GIY-YIG nuclease family protein n=1 Tax=Thalassobaculum sp. TaxID=2022740 RepID=UPI0032ED8B41
MQDPIQPRVYILASRRNGTLYTGVTGDLVRRVAVHRAATVGFCARYGVHRLAYFELHGGMEEAILREKRVKRWRRAWKLALIEGVNPGWDDLYDPLRAGSLDLERFAAPPARGHRGAALGPGPSPDRVRSRPG